MKAPDEFDRQLMDWMTDAVAGPPVVGRFERVMEATARRRPRPSWLAAFGSDWISPAPRRSTLPERWALGLAWLLLLAALLAATIGIAVVASRPQNDELSVVPPAVPSGEPSAAPASSDPTSLSETFAAFSQTLTWTEYAGSADAIPWGLDRLEDGRYAAQAASDEWWVSNDGLAWEILSDEPGISASSRDYAVIDGDCPELPACEPFYYQSGGESVAVRIQSAVPPPVIATFAGATYALPWSSARYEGEAFGSTAILRMEQELEIPWAVILGQTDASCIERSACETSGLEMGVSGADLSGDILDPLGALEQARFSSGGPPLQATLVDDRLTFRRAASGETMVTMVGVSEDMIVRLLQTGNSLGLEFYVVSISGGPAQPISLPIPTQIVQVPGGGLAAYGRGDGAPGADVADALPLRTWTSGNGVTWIDRGPLTFTGPDQFSVPVSDPDAWIEIFAFDGQLIGHATGDNLSRVGPEYWVSSDGVDWRPAPAGHPYATRPDDANPEGRVAQADFGYVDWGELTEPTDRLRVWISQSGQRWVEVEGPPAPDPAHGQVGQVSWGAVGDLLYYTQSYYDGQPTPGGEDRRVLWVGHFE